MTHAARESDSSTPSANIWLPSWTHDRSCTVWLVVVWVEVAVVVALVVGVLMWHSPKEPSTKDRYASSMMSIVASHLALVPKWKIRSSV